MNFLIIIFYIILSIFLLTYSYGFVDFNLTLSSHPLISGFVSWSQTLAFFNRPLSTWVYLGLVTSYFLIYLFALTRKFTLIPWKFLILLSLILAFAYPFLSSDVFKYLFSARMVLDYGLNPHLVSPMDVPGVDLWLRFMRWIHTPSPYGPVMTALTIPFYLLGLKKFTPTLYLFKLDQVAWYLLSVFIIGKLARTLKLGSKQVLAQLFFALNPLVLFEWLVNAHNDAPMITLLLLSLYLVTISRPLVSLLTLMLSIGIKYVTVVFLPFILIRRPKFTLLFTIYSLFFTLALVPYFYHYTNQFQPWYITWLVPLAGLTMSSGIMILTAAYSLGALLRYLPYIATGLWSASPFQFALLTYTPLLLTIVYLSWRQLFVRKL